MEEAVSSILIGRSRQADGLNRMIMVSLIVHGVLLTAVMLMPRDWLRAGPEEQVSPMVISLGPSGTADTANGKTRNLRRFSPPDHTPGSSFGDCA